MIKIEIDDGWSTDWLSPLNYGGNLRRHHNWMAVVNGFDDGGNEVRDYLTESNDSDTYFFFGDKVHEEDIIAVGCYDRYKPYRSARKYYKVFKVTPEEVELSDAQTTYRKAKKLEIIEQTDIKDEE